MNILLSIKKAAYELLGIVLVRFRTPSRIFAIILMLVNMGSLFFLETIFGKTVFSAMILGVIVMIVIYQNLGFVRLLGIGHIFWFPLVPWIFVQLPIINNKSSLYNWLVSLIIINSISLLIDTLDVYRYLMGNKNPYYYWSKPNISS